MLPLLNFEIVWCFIVFAAKLELCLCLELMFNTTSVQGKAVLEFSMTNGLFSVFCQIACLLPFTDCNLLMPNLDVRM